MKVTYLMERSIEEKIQIEQLVGERTELIQEVETGEVFSLIEEETAVSLEKTEDGVVVLHVGRIL